MIGGTKAEIWEIWGHHSYFICVRHVAGYDAGMARDEESSGRERGIEHRHIKRSFHPFL
jgi:hypothetical protein